MTLRASTGTNGIATLNFYADTYGNMGTEYLGRGLSLKDWLALSGADSRYAFVTKWYDQGMDFSFNCATQYNTSQQPIYDVSFKLINFGYQGSGGGVVAPQTNCVFNLPDYTFPTGDGSYTTILKNYNMPIS